MIEALRSWTPPRPAGLPLLSEIDIATGWLAGFVKVPSPRPTSVHPVEALRGVIRTALQRPPCIVSFSGGRDSSIVLALAADTARRDGLPAPIAVTYVYPGDADADETDHQDAVLGHLATLGLKIECERVPVRDEFDLVGPLMAPVLTAHGGPVWPSSIAPSLALASRAQGGSVLTGEFGDEITGPQRMTYLRVTAGRRGRGLSREDWRFVVAAALPGTIGSRVDTGPGDLCPWLTPVGRAEMLRRQRSDFARRPFYWDRSVRHWMKRRAASVGKATMDTVASWFDCLQLHPLGEPAFVDSFAKFGGKIGMRSRSAATDMLSAGMLPESVVRRQSKSTFNASRFGTITREFVERWDGSGVDGTLVDAGILASVWRTGRFEAPSALLLQQAWLAAHDRVGE